MVMMMLAKLPPKSLRKTTNPSPSFSSHNDLEMTQKKSKIALIRAGLSRPATFTVDSRLLGKKSPTFSKSRDLFKSVKVATFSWVKVGMGKKSRLFQ
jgi:hypothetical protein